MKHILNIVTDGLSLKEIYESNKKLFRDLSTIGEADFDQWWKKESFINDKFEAGIWEVIIMNQILSDKEISEGYIIAPISLVAEVIIEHYKKTGDKLYEGAYIKTGTKALNKDNREFNVLFGSCFGYDEFKISGFLMEQEKDNMLIALAKKVK